MEILQIDDSDVICNLYTDMLSSRGHSVSCVNDGKEGLELVTKNDYDLILLDICMPEYSGMDFLADLKNQRPSELKKVIIISQLELDENQLEHLSEFGIHSIQAKPSDLVSLETPEKLVV
jgi:CheY-like chemotaxis protein